MFNRILKSDWYKSESHYIAFLNKECIKISFKHLQLIVTEKNGTETFYWQTHKGKTVYSPHLQSGGMIQWILYPINTSRTQYFRLQDGPNQKSIPHKWFYHIHSKGTKIYRNLDRRFGIPLISIPINMYLYLEFLSTFIFLCTNNRGSK